MNYIGSKYKLSGFIVNTVKAVVGEDLSAKIFCDLFAGTGIVGRGFKAQVKQIISNDLEYYSYVLNQNYIGNHLPIENKNQLIEELKAAPPKEGFIYKNYCKGGHGERMYFSDENAKKIDSIRISIKGWKQNKIIDNNEYFFLLASLLESADKIANTASVYGAYLKKLKKTAQAPLQLTAADFLENENKHTVFNADGNRLIKKIEGDILYLDPPYNARQYGANYHLLNTIARYDKFIPKGKTGLRHYNKSEYCSKTSIEKSFEELIRNAQFSHIFLSYNNEGLMPEGTIRHIMKKYGHYSREETSYQRFKADKTENRQHKFNSTTEYLHILEKLG
ncbi:DNA adenine methylase [Arachidicoccus sp.]|uniref:DNA adenine methylase n=1 Tax=Arachidicoccus sp. TaxID=1872624 RepID=UPI003D1AC6F7